MTTAVGTIKSVQYSSKYGAFANYTLCKTHALQNMKVGETVEIDEITMKVVGILSPNLNQVATVEDSSVAPPATT
jgi:hypothetical protein